MARWGDGLIDVFGNVKTRWLRWLLTIVLLIVFFTQWVYTPTRLW